MTRLEIVTCANCEKEFAVASRDIGRRDSLTCPFCTSNIVLDDEDDDADD